MSFLPKIFSIISNLPKIFIIITKEEYKDNWNKINNRSLLTFNSYKEDLKIRQDNLRYESFHVIPFICFFLLYMFIMIFITKNVDEKFIMDNRILSYILISLAAIILFVILNMVIKFLMINLIIQFPKIGIIIVPLITYLIFFKLYKDLFPILPEPYLIFIIIPLSIFSIFQSWTFINLLPNYLDVEISDTVTLLLSIFAVLTKVFPFKLPLVIDIFFVVIIITLNVLSISLKQKYKSNRKEANGLFIRQLLSEEINYTSLLKCYAIGGKEYKDKIMDNERFLRKINSVEDKNIK